VNFGSIELDYNSELDAMCVMREQLGGGVLDKFYCCATFFVRGVGLSLMLCNCVEVCGEEEMGEKRTQ